MKVRKECRRGHPYNRMPSGSCRDCARECKKPKEDRASQRKIYGVGFNSTPRTGFLAKSQLGGIDPHYDHWRRMLQRSYDPGYKEKHPTYEECEVSEEWFDWQEFAAWSFQQPYGVRPHLDKDLLVIGNKKYSHETCLYLPQELNKALHSVGRRVATWHKRDEVWETSYRGKYLGRSNSELTFAEDLIAEIKTHINYLGDIYANSLDKRGLEAIRNPDLKINEGGFLERVS